MFQPFNIFLINTINEQIMKSAFAFYLSASNEICNKCMSFMRITIDTTNWHCMLKCLGIEFVGVLILNGNIRRPYSQCQLNQWRWEYRIKSAIEKELQTQCRILHWEVLKKRKKKKFEQYHSCWEFFAWKT